MAAELVRRLELIFDVPLKIELILGTYRACTGTTGRHHAFGLRKSALNPS
jgi:hypothetical protein